MKQKNSIRFRVWIAYVLEGFQASNIIDDFTSLNIL